MMDLVTAIKGRRSISHFEDKPVDRKLIDHLISVAGFAPSSCNTQPWYFLIFDTSETKNRLNEYICEGYEETAGTLRGKHRLVGWTYTTLLEFFSQYGKFDSAPVEIMTFARPYDTPVFSQAISFARDPEIEGIAQDSTKTSAAMAVQNLLLIAHANGLGTRVKDGVKFIIGHEGLKARFYKEFDIPNEFTLVSGIQLGYPTPKALQRQAHKRKHIDAVRRYV